MMLKMIGLVAAVSLMPAIAFAQGSSIDSRNINRSREGVAFNTVAPQPNNDHAAAGTAARDGCINVPGEPHNSADCSRIPDNDRNTVMNRDEMAGDRVSGATENAARNARILSGQSLN